MRIPRRGRAGVEHGLAFRSTPWLVALTGVLVLAYFLGLMTPDGKRPFVNVGLSAVAQSAPVLIFWIVAYRTRFARREVVCAAVGVTAWVCAEVFYAFAKDRDGNLPFPSIADVGYLLFYPFILAALVVMVRRQSRIARRSDVLDAVVAALGAAAVFAAALTPVMGATFDGSDLLADIVSLAYPLLDVILVAVIVGIAASPRLDLGPRWMSLVAGLAVFAAADVAFANLENNGSYSANTPLNASWALGLLLIAWWVEGFGRPDDAPSRPGNRSFSRSLPLPAIAVVAGLAVLLVGTQVPISVLALVLAGATVGLAAVPLIFRQAVLHRESRTDPLTGLLNRRALTSDAHPRFLLGKGGATGGRSALLLLDLDKFKEVNDSLGHEAGDQLLIQVSERLSRTLRSVDLLARLGGDEFAILLEGAGEEQAVEVASKVRAALSDPFTVGGVIRNVSVSMGIALYPGQGNDLSELLRLADMAMYQAKVARSGHRVFTKDDDHHSATRVRTVQELRVALRDDQLLLHFQPKINLSTGDVHGVEALVRWNHPERGLLLPDEFIRLVEESGLMPDLTRTVLEKALDQAATWRARGQELTVAVNVSPSSLVDSDLPQQIAALLAVRGLPASTLILEITEDFLMSDRVRSRAVLTQLRDVGVQIAVDDFGIGYSSLSYLRDLPIDELKLDRSFVLPMADDARAAALVASTVDLAHSLGLRMVAEGVEDAAAYDALARYGCDVAQGFFMSRPVPAADLDAWFVARSELNPARLDV